MKAQLVAGAAKKGISFWGLAKAGALFTDALGNIIDGVGAIVHTFVPAPEDNLADASGVNYARSSLLIRYGLNPKSSNIMAGGF